MRAHDRRPRQDPRDSDSSILLPRSGSSVPAAGGRPTAEPLATYGLLSVDDAGEFLLVAGDRLRLGHVHAGLAELPLLADVGPLHAELQRTNSLARGPAWRIAPCAGELVDVQGHSVAARGTPLYHRASVGLARNARLRFDQPDPASRAALLTLEGGLECAGAAHIVLLAPGPGGRLTLGPGRRRHLRVRGLAFDVTIELCAEALLLRADVPLGDRRAGLARGQDAGQPVRLAFPPTVRVDLELGPRRQGRPPFCLGLSPAQPFGPGAPGESLG